MKNLIQAAVVTLFAASTAQAQQAVQWKVSDGGNGHWYRFVPDTNITWTESRTKATLVGGDLATITSPSEQAFVFSMVSASGQAWSGPWGPFLGATRRDTPYWTWVSGEAWNYQAWGPGEPNNDSGGSGPEERLALLNSGAGGAWNDVTDSACAGSSCQARTSSGYVIEWSADCNNDGIVDYGQCRDGSLPDYNGNNIPDCCERGEPCVVGNYPVQWRVEDGGNGHWYVAARQLRVWSSARADAQSVGGYLATTTSEAELEFLRPILANALGADYWLGGSRVAGTNTWAWITSEPFVFTAWEPGEPDNLPNSTCLEVIGRSQLSGFGLWNDELPDATGPGNYSLIEWSADCNGDGIVDYGQILQGDLADSNSNGVPDSCESPTCADADLFPTGTVNGADLGALLSQWGEAPTGTASDLNRDGAVDGTDLGILLAFWGPCPN